MFSQIKFIAVSELCLDIKIKRNSKVKEFGIKETTRYKEWRMQHIQIIY